MEDKGKIMDKEELKHLRVNNRKKTIIGLLLLLVVGYFIWSNYGVGWTALPSVGKVVQVTHGESTTCVETRGPKYLIDTEITKLDIAVEDFKVLKESNRALLTVLNQDVRDGTVRVTIYCEDGEQQGEQVKEIRAGKSETLVFNDVDDCDLSYLIEPQIFRERINRTVYIEGAGCD